MKTNSFNLHTMCLLILNDKGLPLNPDTIEKAAFTNSDGYGRLCLKTGKVFRTLDMKDAVKKALKSGPAIHHFRWASWGGKGHDNVHPFPVAKGYYLFHNGTVSGFSRRDITDTEQIARLLRLVPEEQYGDALAMFESKFIVASVKQEKIIRAGAGWTDIGGIWYSNTFSIAKERIAVYGTLKSSEILHKMLDKERFLGWGNSTNKHRLCFEGIPYLIQGMKDGKGEKVEMELYEVSHDTLDDLDRLEGHPNHYERKRVMVDMEDGKVEWAWCYFAPESKDNGTYLKCFGESWVSYLEKHKKEEEKEEKEEKKKAKERNPVLFKPYQRNISTIKDKAALKCPKCDSDEVMTMDDFVYCEGCHHFTGEAANRTSWTRFPDSEDHEDEAALARNLGTRNFGYN